VCESACVRVPIRLGSHELQGSSSRGETYEQRECLLELGDLLLGERVSLRQRVSGSAGP
jgi:hypothetical protein